MERYEIEMLKTAINKCWEHLRSEGYKKFGCITQAEKIIQKYEKKENDKLKRDAIK